MKYPEVEQMEKDLRAAGWLPIMRAVWQSPEGGFYLGPFGAWKELRKRKADENRKAAKAFSV